MLGGFDDPLFCHTVIFKKNQNNKKVGYKTYDMDKEKGGVLNQRKKKKLLPLKNQRHQTKKAGKFL